MVVPSSNHQCLIFMPLCSIIAHVKNICTGMYMQCSSCHVIQHPMQQVMPLWIRSVLDPFCYTTTMDGETNHLATVYLPALCHHFQKLFFVRRLCAVSLRTTNSTQPSTAYLSNAYTELPYIKSISILQPVFRSWHSLIQLAASSLIISNTTMYSTLSH